MKHKTLFRLMLKAVGVWIFAMGAVRVVDVLFNVIGMLITRGGGINYNYYWFSIFGGAAETAFGLYLFFGGKWIADKAIPSNRPYCHECGYDLTGAVGNVCNECGTPFRMAAQAHE